ARVVDFPEPVVPVTSTKPRCSSQILFSSNAGTSEARHAVSHIQFRRFLELLLLSVGHHAESHRKHFSRCAAANYAVRCDKAIESISSGVTRGTSVSGVSRPSTRKYGWFPTFRCKSEDLFSTARRSRSSTLVGIVCKPRKSAASVQLSSDGSIRGKDGQGRP